MRGSFIFTILAAVAPLASIAGDNDTAYFAATPAGIEVRPGPTGPLSTREIAAATVVVTPAGTDMPPPPVEEKAATEVLKMGSDVPGAVARAPEPAEDGKLPDGVLTPDLDGTVFLAVNKATNRSNPFDPARVLTGKAAERTVFVICIVEGREGRYARINKITAYVGQAILDGVVVDTIRRDGVIVRVGESRVFCPVGLGVRLLTSS